MMVRSGEVGRWFCRFWDVGSLVWESSFMVM